MNFSDVYGAIRSTYPVENPQDENAEIAFKVNTFPTQAHALRDVIANTDWSNAEWTVHHVVNAIYAVFFGPWPVYGFTLMPYRRKAAKGTDYCTPIDDDAHFIAILEFVDYNLLIELQDRNMLSPEIVEIEYNADLTGKIPEYSLYTKALLLNAWMKSFPVSREELISDKTKRDALFTYLAGQYISQFAPNGEFSNAIARFADRNGCVITTMETFLDTVFFDVLQIFSKVLLGEYFGIKKAEMDTPMLEFIETLKQTLWSLKFPGDEIHILNYDSVGMWCMQPYEGNQKKIGARFYYPCEYYGFFGNEETVLMEFFRRVNEHQGLAPLHGKVLNYHVAWNVSRLSYFPSVSLQKQLRKLLIDHVKKIALFKENLVDNAIQMILMKQQDILVKSAADNGKYDIWRSDGRTLAIIRCFYESVLPLNAFSVITEKTIQYNLPLAYLPEIYRHVIDSTFHPNFNFVVSPDDRRVIDVYTKGFPLFTLRQKTAEELPNSEEGIVTILPQNTVYYELDWYDHDHVPMQYKQAYRVTWLINICANVTTLAVSQKEKRWVDNYESILSLDSLSKAFSQLNAPIISLIPLRQMTMLDTFLHTTRNAIESGITKRTLTRISNLDTIPVKSRDVHEKEDIARYGKIVKDVAYIQIEDETVPYLVRWDDITRIESYNVMNGYSKRLKIDDYNTSWFTTIPLDQDFPGGVKPTPMPPYDYPIPQPKPEEIYGNEPDLSGMVLVPEPGEESFDIENYLLKDMDLDQPIPSQPVSVDEIWNLLIDN